MDNNSQTVEWAGIPTHKMNKIFQEVANTSPFSKKVMKEAFEEVLKVFKKYVPSTLKWNVAVVKENFTYKLSFITTVVSVEVQNFKQFYSDLKQTLEFLEFTILSRDNIKSTLLSGGNAFNPISLEIGFELRMRKI